MSKRPAFSLGFRFVEKAFLLLTVMLCLIGLVFVFEASVSEAFQTFGNQFYFIKQQAIWFGVGLVALLAGIVIPTSYWRKTSAIFYFGSLLLLLCVFIPGLGKSVNGAHRWIEVARVTLQPVELVKFSLIIFFASWMEKHQKLAPFLFLTALPLGLLLLQPDMGSALIVVAIAFGIYYLAGAPYRIFFAVASLGIFLLFLMILISPYRLKRVTTFLNPESDPLGASFHIHQITLALGSGGLLGEGIGQSRQKFSYLPEASTDSIFAIIGEEVGFLGSVVIIGLFAGFLHFANKIVQKTQPRSFQHLLASGILIWLGTQISLNLAAIVALVPLTGIPLPFFSYGGSSLVMILFVTGILVGIGRRQNLAQR